MEDNQAQIDKLLYKLQLLMRKQNEFAKEIGELRNDIQTLKTSSSGVSKTTIKVIDEVEADIVSVPDGTPIEEPIQIERSYIREKLPKPEPPKRFKLPNFNLDIEKFIGENLINKIGIAITIIGVAIGAKYSIENELISPLTRIVLGYIAGIGLLGVGMKLKKKYLNYSAVLVSGAMAIMYFITYAAYSFYGLIPQIPAFGLLVLFTVFTVFAALHYNSQVIAIIGLVGAYAVPFLLSNESGNPAILFGYTTIINIGILFIAFKKHWKILFYSAFVFTWLIYFSWISMGYDSKEHFTIGLIFSSIFFAIFYLSFLAYKLIRKEKFGKQDIAMILLNSFLFFGAGYFLLDDHETGSQYLGLFALANAVIHFLVSTIIYKQKLADRNLFFLIAGLVLVFITIAIPIQLDGNWVTLLWAGEAALLFWIGRTKAVPFYELLSYPLMGLALLSILGDWDYYDRYSPDDPSTKLNLFANVKFLSSLLFAGAFAFINYIHQDAKYTSALSGRKSMNNIFSVALPAILIGVIYFAFKIEIETYWDQLYRDSTFMISNLEQKTAGVYGNRDLRRFGQLCTINFSLLFVSVLAFLNIKKFKNAQFALVNLGLLGLAIIAFLGQGLLELSELRTSYLIQTGSEFFNIDKGNLSMRYISYPFLALAIYACYQYLKSNLISFKLANVFFDFLIAASIIWVASSELLHWMDMMGHEASYKLALSILWGISALILIGVGIYQKKRHLRIGAIALFAVTLVKLFVYDINHLDTISKTILFVSLGILLLIISFLYNKYKLNISDDPKV